MCDTVIIKKMYKVNFIPFKKECVIDLMFFKERITGVHKLLPWIYAERTDFSFFCIFLVPNCLGIVFKNINYHFLIIIFVDLNQKNKFVQKLLKKKICIDT